MPDTERKSYPAGQNVDSIGFYEWLRDRGRTIGGVVTIITITTALSSACSSPDTDAAPKPSTMTTEASPVPPTATAEATPRPPLIIDRILPPALDEDTKLRLIESNFDLETAYSPGKLNEIMEAIDPTWQIAPDSSIFMQYGADESLKFFVAFKNSELTAMGYADQESGASFTCVPGTPVAQANIASLHGGDGLVIAFLREYRERLNRPGAETVMPFSVEDKENPEHTQTIRCGVVGDVTTAG